MKKKDWEGHFSFFLLKRIASPFDTELILVFSLLYPDVHDVSEWILLKNNSGGGNSDFKIQWKEPNEDAMFYV